VVYINCCKSKIRLEVIEVAFKKYPFFKSGNY